MDHGPGYKAYKFLKQMRKSLWLELSKDFSDMTRKAQSNKKNNDKLDFIEMKTSAV